MSKCDTSHLVHCGADLTQSVHQCSVLHWASFLQTELFSLGFPPILWWSPAGRARIWNQFSFLMCENEKIWISFVLRGDAGVTLGVFRVGHHGAGFRVKFSIRTVWTILICRTRWRFNYISKIYSIYYIVMCVSAVIMWWQHIDMNIMLHVAVNISKGEHIIQTHWLRYRICFSHRACPVGPFLSALEPQPVESCVVRTSLPESPGRQSGCWQLKQDNMSTTKVLSMFFLFSTCCISFFCIQYSLFVRFYFLYKSIWKQFGFSYFWSKSVTSSSHWLWTDFTF